MSKFRVEVFYDKGLIKVKVGDNEVIPLAIWIAMVEGRLSELGVSYDQVHLESVHTKVTYER